MRFPVDVRDEESIPGALVKGIRDNVLERASVFFDDAGLTQRKAGLTQVMSPSELERLAAFMKCDVRALASRAGTLKRRGTKSLSASFGALELHGADVELERRRIGPTTLRDQPFHHDAWLFSLLPYCPVSLERLVENCSTCGTGLGWSRCWGIGVCEWCRNQVEPSGEPPLLAELAENYRTFADLLSPREDVRRAANLQLPPIFHDVAPGSIVTMALRLGQICRADQVVGVRRESLRHLDPTLLASVVTTGTSMMRTWPDSFVQWAMSEFDDRCDDLQGHHRIRAQIKRLGNPRLEDHAQVRLVRAALPQEFGSFVHSAASKPFVTATEFKRRTSVKPERLNVIRQDLEDRRLPGLERIRSQLNVRRVREFEERYRTSLRLRCLTFQFMLPTYAIEQMVCMDLIPQESDRVVRMARRGMCVQQASVDQLVSEIRGQVLRGAGPSDAIPIEAAARQIGGREKPWGAIFKALSEGGLEFWLSNEEKVTSRTIRVRAASLAQFQHIVFETAPHYAFPFLKTINSSEVEEILNVAPKYLPLLVDQRLLSLSSESGRNSADKSDVLRLARLMVSPAELGFAMGQHPRPAGRVVAKLGVRRVGCGWSRADLVEAGIVRAPPQPQHRLAMSVIGQAERHQTEVTNALGWRPRSC